jgi:hypothetical protein
MVPSPNEIEIADYGNMITSNLRFPRVQPPEKEAV